MDMIVLAGGIGSRIASLTENKLPKAMLAVNGKPFLAYLLDWAAAQGVTHITLAVGFQASAISAYFGSTHGSLQLTYVDEGNARLGTGGALKRACTQLPGDQPVFAVNGDTLFPIPLAQLAQFHQSAGADFTLALTRIKNAGRYGRVVTDPSGRVTAFEEKQPHTEAFINGGVYCFKPALLQTVADNSFSLERDVLEANRISIYAKYFPQSFRDIGTPDDFHAFQAESPS